MNIKELNKEENRCIEQGIIFPELTKKVLSNIDFKPSKREIRQLLLNMGKGFGLIINLNKEFDLRLQYHGRFESFLIGFGIAPNNINQPNLKLLRIETNVENTHNQDIMTFLNKIKIRGPHIHWYNSFYKLFVNPHIFDIKNPNKEVYNYIIKTLLNNKQYSNFSIGLLNKAMPYNLFIKLCYLVVEEGRVLREDGDITISKTLSKDTTEILNQILSKKFIRD